jgi:hypothetical protein
MTTTFSAMPRSRFLLRRRKGGIIEGALHLLGRRLGLLFVVLVPLLAGCSSVRLLYGNAPQLAWWWVDGYADLSREQAPAARQALDDFFDWHRRTQLNEYAAFLGTVAPQLAGPMTPQQACSLQQQVRKGLEAALQQALARAADVVPRLTDANFKAIEQRYAKANATMRDDFLQPDPAERAQAAFKRTLERAERLYGSLGEAQQRVLREGLAASPFDPEAWLAERQRRQRDTLATLRQLAAEPAPAEQRIAALRALAQRTERSPDAGYRAYQQRLAEDNCAFFARLHNATTAAQRQRALERLAAWEADLRLLARSD